MVNGDDVVRVVDGMVVGVVVLSYAMGFGGPIGILIGIDMNGTIVGVEILEHLETPGIGSRITEDVFLNQFIGKHPPINVDAITGATISSQAVIGRIKEDVARITPIVEGEE